MNYWIRYVVVPGLTNNEVDIKKVGEFIQTLKNFQKINLLKYHTMAVSKRKELGREYPLKGVPEAGDEEIQKVKKFLSKYIDKNLIQ